MTIDEAIAHAREVAERNRKQWKNCPAERDVREHLTCEECAEEHEQIAEWLEELKANRIALEKANGYLEANYRLGYSKGIDDFKKILTIEKIKEYAESDGFINLNNCSLMIFDIAEQLKEGGEND